MGTIINTRIRFLTVLKTVKGNFWFVPYFGLTQFDGKYFTTYNAEQGIDSLGEIDKIVEDKTGALWLATWAYQPL